MWGHPGWFLGSPWAPPDCLESYVCGVIKEETWEVLGILWISWRVVSVEAPREDPEISLGSFGQHGGLCVWGQLGVILGRPWDPPDCLEGCVLGDIQGGSWDTLGILQAAWRAGCGGTSREDPRMPLGSSRLPGGLCVGDIQGGSWDTLGIPQTAWRAGYGGTSREVLGILRSARRVVCVRTSREDPVMSSNVTKSETKIILVRHLYFSN